MKLQVRVIGCLAAAALALCQLAADCRSKCFSDMTLPQAIEAAKKDGKVVIADFTATWCGPCHKMEETTWTNAEVEAWIAKNAIAVQIDVDKDEKLSAENKINAMPSVLLFKPAAKSAEFDRKVGYQGAKEFISWLESANKGVRSIDLMKTKFQSIEGKGGELEIKGRIEYARALMDEPDYEAATPQFLWLWKNMLKVSPAWAGVRGSYMAKAIEGLTQHYEPAKTAFMQLRTEAKDGDIHDWVALNRILGTPDETLTWFDSVKKDPAKYEQLMQCRVDLENLLVERKRWADVACLYRDPLAEVKREHQFAKVVLQQVPDYNPFPQMSSLIYGSLLAAGRNDEAKQVEAECLRLEDTAEMRAMLKQAASKMGPSTK